MDKNPRGASGTTVVLLVLMLVLFFSSVVIINVNGVHGPPDEQEHSKKTSSLWAWQRLRSTYSIYSSLVSPTKYWHLAKAIVNQAYTYFFPPNIDFRRGIEAEAVTGGENGAAGEKMKEALAKSLGTSKATLEDAAKSAADIAGETIGKAKEKVKRSFSEEDTNKEESRHQNEL